jgi:hypothetical protein
MQISGDTLLIASAFGFAGLIAGIVITLLFSPRKKAKKEAKEVEQPVPIQKPEPRPEPRPQPVLRTQPPVPQKRHPDEAHLWRDPQAGKVMAEIDGVHLMDPKTCLPSSAASWCRCCARWLPGSMKAGQTRHYTTCAARYAAAVCRMPTGASRAQPAILIEPKPSAAPAGCERKSQST